MDSYTFALVFGGVGLVAMGAMGAAHLGGGGHSHAGHTHTGHGHAGGPASNSHHAGHGHGVNGDHTHGHSRETALKGTLFTLVSPRVIFTLLFGFGVTGLLLRNVLTGLLLPVIAVAGALIFEWAIVAPVWSFAFRFASHPATTLESSTDSEARAATAFDGDGHGLVIVEVDGQIVQCLGTLRPEDRALGIHVRAGDVLRVEDVDAARQRCTVSYVRREATPAESV